MRMSAAACVALGVGRGAAAPRRPPAGTWLSTTIGPGGFGRWIRQSARLPFDSVACMVKLSGGQRLRHDVVQLDLAEGAAGLLVRENVLQAKHVARQLLDIGLRLVDGLQPLLQLAEAARGPGAPSPAALSPIAASPRRAAVPASAASRRGRGLRLAHHAEAAAAAQLVLARRQARPRRSSRPSWRSSGSIIRAERACAAQRRISRTSSRHDTAPPPPRQRQRVVEAERELPSR